MSLLQRLASLLYQRAPDYPFNYRIPDTWNLFGYTGKEARRLRSGEWLVNPYCFWAELIESVILKAGSQAEANDSARSLKTADGKGGDWIRRASVYSLMVRHSTSWDHDGSGELEDSNLYGLKETGTFIKTLALLPLLKHLGVDTLYLLPISRFSKRYRKGDLGSPYSVQDFFALDDALKDPMTGDGMTLEEEFRALVEACHRLQIRVMIDIIPRTNAVDSVLIEEHPEWFYWIRREDAAGYRPPRVHTLGPTVVPKAQFLPQVYDSDDVRRHLEQFVENPRTQDPLAWGRFLKQWRKSGERLDDAIAREYGCVVAPAFSDHINDTQPPWSDVTFFRMFLDHPEASKPFIDRLGKEFPPYILFDTIKSDLYPGAQPNLALWETLAGVIPHFQQVYGVDGARIDMGHALPEALVRKIIRSARAVDPDFCFVAEELYPDRAEGAARLGYNLIIGQGFYMTPRVWEHGTHAYYYGSHDVALPVFASGETHDTPRLVAREGGKGLARMISVLNCFTPNGVPFLNAGQELYEVQPINTGLDCRPDEAFRIPESDPAYGRLALFDRVALHYLEPDRWEMLETLHQVAQIRQRYLEALTDPDAFVGLGFEHMGIQAIGLSFMLTEEPTQKPDAVLMVIANTHLYEDQDLFVDLSAARARSGNPGTQAQQLFSTHGTSGLVSGFDPQGNLQLNLAATEVKIIYLGTGGARSQSDPERQSELPQKQNTKRSKKKIS